MIEVEVDQIDIKTGNNEIIIRRVYNDPDLTLEGALKKMEKYIVSEGINVNGECVMRVRYSNLLRY